MTGRTALEIYFNPDDIELYIGEEKDKKDIWGLVISRGPRLDQHPFKLLVTSNEKSNFTKAIVLQIIEKELCAVKKFGDEIFTSTEYGLLKSLTCNGFESKDDYVKNYAPVLEDSDIERIMIELKNEDGENAYHSTPWKWKIWKERYLKNNVA